MQHCDEHTSLCRGKKISDIAWFMYGMTGFLFFIAAGQSRLHLLHLLLVNNMLAAVSLHACMHTIIALHIEPNRASHVVTASSFAQGLCCLSNLLCHPVLLSHIRLEQHQAHCDTGLHSCLCARKHQTCAATLAGLSNANIVARQSQMQSRETLQWRKPTALLVTAACFTCRPGGQVICRV